MDEKQELPDYQLLFDEVINTAKSYKRILTNIGGKDQMLDSILITAMAAIQVFIPS